MPQTLRHESGFRAIDQLLFTGIAEQGVVLQGDGLQCSDANTSDLNRNIDGLLLPTELSPFDPRSLGSTKILFLDPDQWGALQPFAVINVFENIITSNSKDLLDAVLH